MNPFERIFVEQKCSRKRSKTFQYHSTYFVDKITLGHNVSQRSQTGGENRQTENTFTAQKCTQSLCIIRSNW